MPLSLFLPNCLGGECVVCDYYIVSEFVRQTFTQACRHLHETACSACTCTHTHPPTHTHAPTPPHTHSSFELKSVHLIHSLAAREGASPSEQHWHRDTGLLFEEEFHTRESGFFSPPYVCSNHPTPILLEGNF